MKDDCLTAALRFIGKRPSWTPAKDYHGDRPCLPLQSWHRIAQWSQWEQKRKRSKYNFWFEQFKRTWEPAPYWSFLEMPKLLRPYLYK
jgi:hypothetical protein